MATFLPNFRANEEESLFEIYDSFSRIFNLSYVSGSLSFLSTAIDLLPFETSSQDIYAYYYPRVFGKMLYLLQKSIFSKNAKKKMKRENRSTPSSKFNFKIKSLQMLILQDII